MKKKMSRRATGVATLVTSLLYVLIAAGASKAFILAMEGKVETHILIIVAFAVLSSPSASATINRTLFGEYDTGGLMTEQMEKSLSSFIAVPMVTLMALAHALIGGPGAFTMATMTIICYALLTRRVKLDSCVSVGFPTESVVVAVQ